MAELIEIEASIESKDAVNLIREVVDGAKRVTNPDKELLKLSVGKKKPRKKLVLKQTFVS